MNSSWQIWRDRRGRLSPLRFTVIALLVLPLAKALFDAEAIAHAARPINDLIHRAGFWALVFLGVTLAIAPFRRIARFNELIDVRRMLGVGTFCYVAAHITLFVADQGYDLGKALHEVSHRVYLIIGGTAALGLAAMAATSTDGMQRWIGPVRWRRLHQVIYAVALLALIHYFQQTKADVTVPVFAAGLFLWLAGYRVAARRQKGGELSTLSLLLVTVTVSLLVFAGEAIGFGIAFHVSPLRVLGVALDFSAGMRPGWQVLGAGLCVVALDIVRGRWHAARPRTVAAQ